MDDTHEFVEKIHENQDKQKQNEKHQRKGHDSHKLPSKKHNTNK